MSVKIKKINGYELEGSGGVTSWNDLEDRPFYTEGGGSVELMPETQAIDTGDGTFVIPENVPQLTVGETYTVKYNGAVYECVAQDASALVTGGICIGNGTSLGLSGNNEPFAAVIGEEDGQLIMMILPLDGATEVTISISQGGEIIHKLDNKYLDLDWLPIMEREVIIPEVTVSITDSNNPYAEIPNSYVYLADRTEVGVYINGKYYDGVVCIDSDGTYIAGAGSESNVEGVAQRYPFDDKYIIALSESTGQAVFATQVVGTYTVKVVGKNVVANKIPEEFLPDTVATKEWVEELLGGMLDELDDLVGNDKTEEG